NQFDRWIFDNGKRINGLVNRRAAEKKLFLS
ncbi:lysozyme, partial [Acinetobacter baumannii]